MAEGAIQVGLLFCTGSLHCLGRINSVPSPLASFEILSRSIHLVVKCFPQSDGDVLAFVNTALKLEQHRLASQQAVHANGHISDGLCRVHDLFKILELLPVDLDLVEGLVSAFIADTDPFNSCLLKLTQGSKSCSLCLLLCNNLDVALRELLVHLLGQLSGLVQGLIESSGTVAHLLLCGNSSNCLLWSRWLFCMLPDTWCDFQTIVLSLLEFSAADFSIAVQVHEVESIRATTAQLVEGVIQDTQARREE
mmetsp:Transcript_46413/g.84980  ORF Transcript_46413/g.84980 Transcript_46413/m.84980 type:complete len:251 (-) Transcript_46413:136-888(-)